MKNRYEYLVSENRASDFFTVQNKNRNGRLTQLVRILKKGWLMTYFRGYKNIMKIYKAQFNACGLEWSSYSFGDNVNTWQDFLQKNPWYSEASIFVLANTEEQNYGYVLKNVSLEGVRISHEGMSVSTKTGDMLMKIVSTDISLCDMFFVLALGEKRKKYGYNSGPFARTTLGLEKVRRSVHQTVSDVVKKTFIEKCFLTNEHSRFFVPHVQRAEEGYYQGGFIVDDVVPFIFSSDTMEIVNARPDDVQYVVLIDGDHLLVFDMGDFTFVCSQSLMKTNLSGLVVDTLIAQSAKSVALHQQFRKEQFEEKDKTLPVEFYGRLPYVAEIFRKSVMRDVEQFQKEDAQVVIDMIINSSLQEETERKLLEIGECDTFQEFYEKYPNISPATVVILTLFDVSVLTSEHLKTMDFFSRLQFTFDGMIARTIEGNFTKYSSITIPYNRNMADVLRLIGLRHISPSLYAQKIGVAIEKKLANVTNQETDAEVDYLVFSINRRVFVSRAELLEMSTKLDGDIFEFLSSSGKVALVLVELGGVRVYDESLYEVAFISFVNSFFEEINNIQVAVSNKIIRKSEYPYERYFDVPYLKRSLWQKCVQENTASIAGDEITVLNRQIKEKHYPFQYVSKDDVVIGDRALDKISKTVKSLSFSEASVLFKIMTWFPKNTFAGCKLIGKEVIRSQEHSIDRHAFNKQYSEDALKVRGFKTEIKKRLRTRVPIGVNHFKNRCDLLVIDEVYLIGIEEGFVPTIDALLKNFILFLIYKNRLHILKTDGSMINYKENIQERIGILAKYMLNYINVRLGRSSLDGKSDEELYWFGEFDRRFLGSDENPTINVLN